VALAEAIAAAVRSRSELRPSVELEMDPTLANVQVTAHRDRLERVLGHLIQNAAEASGDDTGVLVRASLKGPQVVIEITDSGHGMSEDFIREQLFQPFCSTKAEGMGIGAFESREYIRELSGSIEVASEPGAGSTFTVRLPIRPLNRSPVEHALSAVADSALRDSDQALQTRHG
jgi:signal transduction histidine kinase